MTRAYELILGIHAVLSALRHDPENVRELRVDRGRQDARMRELRALAARLGIPVREVEKAALKRQANSERYQGVIAFYRGAPALDENALVELLDESSQPLLVVLDGVTDPHNLGAILRTAEAAGVNAVIAPRDRAAKVNATVRKTACGAAERWPIVQAVNLARSLRALKEKGLWLIGADEAAPHSLYDLDLTRPLVLLMGSEGRGLRRLTRELCDFVIRIPMARAVQSLNVSVAAGVCLFEIQRQRRARPN
jgi:23S rRNA (guanosine2251-2'-O)-methyltransferase